MQLILLALLSADAGEILWFGDAPDDAATEQIAATTGTTAQPMPLMAFRGASTRVTEADAEAWRTLATTLRDVRACETKLDGELIIMRDLQRATDRIGIVRDDADREALFAAYAYQGFAMERFFAGDTTDERAAPYYTELLERTWVRPWVDAVALAPEREVTAYDIAEAPQRIAFADTRTALTDTALPASLVFPAAIPDGAELVVGGRAQRVKGGDAVSVLPGRHRLHLRVGDSVLARWDLDLAPADERELSLPLDEDTWQAWVDSLDTAAPGALPDGLLDDLASLDDEVWLARYRSGKLDIFRVGVDGTLTETRAARSRRGAGKSDKVGWTVGLGLDGSWVYSGDFYTQDPTAPRTRGTVNAGALGLDMQATVDVGLFRVGAGVDTTVPFGANHNALTGDGGMRLRPYLYGTVGIRWAQVHAGFLFPYHPAMGATLTIPVYEGLEVRAGATFGFRTELTRDDGTAYRTQRFSKVGAGIGWRFR